jgi:L-ascorbate metabolism protein UlaG (beta-lactamase superfamily)
VLLTMDARQGVEALRVVAPRRASPVHFDDDTLFKSSLADFQAEVAAAGLSTDVHYLTRDDTYRFALASTEAETR